MNEWETNRSHSPDLFARQPLLARPTGRLNGTADVDSPELVIRAARLVLVQAGLADRDRRVDCGLADAAKVGGLLTVALAIAECSCVRESLLVESIGNGVTKRPFVKEGDHFGSFHWNELFYVSIQTSIIRNWAGQQFSLIKSNGIRGLVCIRVSKRGSYFLSRCSNGTDCSI